MPSLLDSKTPFLSLSYSLDDSKHGLRVDAEKEWFDRIYDKMLLGRAGY